MNQQDAARATHEAPGLPENATPDEIQLWLADTRTRAHRLIDESVTAAQEALNRRNAAIDEGDATAQAQRHAQRLAVERLRRAIGDLTLEIRGVHGRLDRLESLVRTAVEAPRALSPMPATPAMPAVMTTSIASATPVVGPAAPEAPRELRDAVEAARPEPARAPIEATSATVETPDATTAAPTSLLATGAAESSAEERAPSATSVGESREAVDAPRGDVTAGPPEAPALPTVEPQPAPGFAAEARAAVEAAVASALLEARRAASARTQAAPERDDETNEPTEAPRAPLVEARSPALEVPAPSWPRLATPEPAAPEVPAKAAELASTSAELSAEHEDDEPSQPAPSAEPLTRPSLWVPPSAIAPPRAVATAPSAPPAPLPTEEPEPVREAIAPEPLPRPAATTMVPALPSAPVTTPAPAPTTEPAPSMVPAAARPAPVAAGGTESRFASAPAATVERVLPSGLFEAGDGPVVLRIAPISGFQGLMRVQDAVVQHAPVREATVEAYARGEARLRLQLASALDAEQLASALVRSLGLQARVESVSDEERSIQVTLA